MFHIELRQFPHVARAFNLTPEQLDSRILLPWARGQAVPWEGRQFIAEKARLTIYEGPELRPEELGMGRGWPNVTRAGNDVTDRLLAAARRSAARDPAIDALKTDVLERARAQHPLALSTLLASMSERYPGSAISARLALVERAVWELLHERRLELVDAHDTLIERSQWQPLLLELGSWTEPNILLRRSPRA